MKFIKPIKYGQLTDETSKKHIYTPESSDMVLAPYDGVIYDIDRNKCNGFIQIAHLVNKNVIYSEICGVDKNIFVSNGVEVKQGDLLGYCGKKEVTYQIKDSNKENITIEPFFIGTLDKSSEKEGLKKDKELEKEKEGLKKEKEPKTNTPNKNDSNNEDGNEKKKWNFNREPEEVPDLFSSLFLTPLGIVNKAFTKKKKETKEEELNEEIKRMKQLLK